MVILTREDVGAAVAELARIRARLKQEEGHCDEVIAAAKADLQEQVKELLEKESLYLNVLEDWAAKDRASWGGAKSLKFAGNTVGFRQPPPSLKLAGKVKGGWKGVVERVRRVLGEGYIRTSPEVDKEAVKAAKLDAAKLREAGLKLVPGVEEFYVTTEEVEL